MSGCNILCTDASAWDTQHGSSELRSSVQLITDVVKEVAPDLTDLADELFALGRTV